VSGEIAVICKYFNQISDFSEKRKVYKLNSPIKFTKKGILKGREKRRKNG